jgi:Tfp pilus assembly protein PilZ
VADVTCRLAGRDLRVANLSVGGFFVQTEDGAPPPGQFVELELRLGSRPASRVVGQVVWRHEPDAAASRTAGFGVRITRIELRDKLALIDWLRRLETHATSAAD